MSPSRHAFVALALPLFLLCACEPSMEVGPPDLAGDPLASWYPELPPEGGPAVAAAGRLTVENMAAERVPGPASQGLVGDYFLRNDRIKVVVQAPGRFNGVLPYGGNLIDADRIASPAGDQIGEVGLVLQLGRTVDFQAAQVVRDGSKGGPAVLRFVGRDVADTYFNITGLGGLTRAIRDDLRAFVDLGLIVAVTYVLEPGADAVQIHWSFYNPGDTPTNAGGVATTHGALVDTGADIELFHPYVGYGEGSFTDIVNLQGAPGTEYGALQGSGITYGLLPRYADPMTRGASIAIAGIVVELFEQAALGNIIGDKGQTLVLPAGGGARRRMDFVLGTDVADIEARTRAAKGEETVALSGTVTTKAGTPVAGARIAVDDAVAKAPYTVVTTMTSDAAGHYTARLRPGSYRLQAEADGFFRGPIQDITLAAGGADPKPALVLEDRAEIRYRVRDRAGASIPAKIVVVGRPPAVPDRRFRDIGADHLPLGVAAWLTSREGDSARGTRYDHPITLPAGRYRVVVGRGPEWSRFEQVVDLTAAGVMLDVTLDRVLDTHGYVASDFHQHTYWSPDAPVPPEDRVVGYLAEGIELCSTTEHDVHFDFAPLVAKLAAEELLDTMVGIEVTPFDYGHFIAWPLPVDPLAPNGGAFDWGKSPSTGQRVPPGEIFRGLRTQGAQIVQMCHPRVEPGADEMGGFQANFERAGVTYDFAARTFGGSAKLQPLQALELGLPDGAELFSPDFDALEVANGASSFNNLNGHPRISPITENTMRDWMNFLSFGFTPTAIGDSDSHQWFSSPPGISRSLVRVPDDSSDGIRGGVAEAVVATVKGKGSTPRDVVVTNGPMLAFTVDAAGIGQTVRPQGKTIHIEARAQATSWAPIDTIEIYANATFDQPAPKGSLPGELVPVLCFTSRAVPLPTCKRALGGARALVITDVMVAPGVVRHEAVAMADVDPAALIRDQRKGARGEDLWLIALGTGDRGLFPTIPGGVAQDAQIDRLVEGTAPEIGVPALVFTNPVFVDADGGGWRAPFAP